jgi:predicted O-methyltransferase YrrM
MIRLARGASSHRNALVSDRAAKVLELEKLNNPTWRTVLAASERTFDEWSFNEDSLNLLEEHLRAARPRYTLEFGCGLSTFCTAALLSEIWGRDGDWRIFGIEQDERHAAWVRSILARLDLDDHVSIKVAPLARQSSLGVEIQSYGLTEAEMGEFLGDHRPSFVVIDGPFGDGPVRMPTLPLALPFLAENAVVLLDDALRDNELMIIKAWRNLGVRVHGVRPIRAGLAELQTA